MLYDVLDVVAPFMAVKLKDDLATFLHDRGNQIILSSCDIAMSSSGSDSD